MFFSSKIKIPKDLRARLDGVAKRHDFKDAQTLAEHFVEKGLATFKFVDTSLDQKKQIEQVVEERGYSSREEVIEHLLVRGLKAYEEHEHDPKLLEERLRGLGYIE